MGKNKYQRDFSTTSTTVDTTAETLDQELQTIEQTESVDTEPETVETTSTEEIGAALDQESIVNEETLKEEVEADIETQEPVTTEQTEQSDTNETQEPTQTEQSDTNESKEPVQVEQTDTNESKEPTQAEKVETKEPVVVIPQETDVLKILSSKISFKEKIEAISKSDSVQYRSLANKLLSYNDKMFGTMAVKPSSGAANNYDLYNTIKQAVSDTNPEVFRIKFNIINLAFIAFKNEAFNEFKLHRFDYEWKWGKESLTTYQYLVTAISILADKSTREQEIGKGILDRALDKDDISLNDVAIQNIVKYYKS